MPEILRIRFLIVSDCKEVKLSNDRPINCHLSMSEDGETNPFPGTVGIPKATASAWSNVSIDNTGATVVSNKLNRGTKPKPVYEEEEYKPDIQLRRLAELEARYEKKKVEEKPKEGDAPAEPVAPVEEKPIEIEPKKEKVTNMFAALADSDDEEFIAEEPAPVKEEPKKGGKKGQAKKQEAKKVEPVVTEIKPEPKPEPQPQPEEVKVEKKKKAKKPQPQQVPVKQAPKNPGSNKDLIILGAILLFIALIFVIRFDDVRSAFGSK